MSSVVVPDNSGTVLRGAAGTMSRTQMVLVVGAAADAVDDWGGHCDWADALRGFAATVEVTAPAPIGLGRMRTFEVLVNGVVAGFFSEHGVDVLPVEFVELRGVLWVLQEMRLRMWQARWSSEDDAVLVDVPAAPHA